MSYGTYGTYRVLVDGAGDKYNIVNTETGVVEYDTRVLHEAIRIAKLFDHSLVKAKEFSPEEAYNKSAQQMAALGTKHN